MKQLVVLILFLTTTVWAQTREPVEFSHQTIDGVSLNIVTIDLNSEAIEIRPILAPPGQLLPFDNLLARGEGPFAAITGTFFDPATGTTVGNVVHNGRLMTEGSVGSVLTIGDDGEVGVRSLERKMGRHIDWAGTSFAISAGPTLLTDGVSSIAPASEGFRDRGLYGARIRAAMGVTSDKRLILLTSRQPVTLHNLARIFQTLGAVDAVNLDGGSSTALYHNGQVVSRPSRRLTNLIGIYRAGTAPDQSAALSQQYAKAYRHYQTGVKLLKEKNLVHAHSQVRKALSMAPDRAPYWEVLGEIQEAEQKFGDAGRSFLKAAELYSARSQTDRATQCAATGFRLSPELRQLYPQFASLLPGEASTSIHRIGIESNAR